MMDLIETATQLSSQGVIISVNVKKWNGKLPPRPEWGRKFVKLLPNDVVSAFSDIKSKITGNLLDYSIPCCNGNFVPNRVLKDFILIHKRHCETFYKARGEIIAHYEGFKDASRSAASIKYVECWRKTHPLEQMPPPSGSNFAANLAMSLVPTKESLYDMYKVMIHVFPHSFCFMENDPRFSFIDHGEKKDMAWSVLDELVASSARRLVAGLASTKKTRAFGRKVTQTLRHSKMFANTNLLANTEMVSADVLGIKVQNLIDLVETKTTTQINRMEFYKAVEDVVCFAKKESTVQGILEILN